MYDNDPERITRPDTVPAALRFTETSDISSGVEQRGATRELAPYPALRDVTPPPGEATVVDPPLRRALESAQHASEQRREADALKELRSGPRHRVVSTVPPPSRARRKPAGAVNVVTRSEAQQPRPEQARAPGNRRWPLVLAFVLTALASAAVGTTLGNGSVERFVGRLVESPPTRATAFILPISAALEKPREPLLSPSPEPVPIPDAAEVPSVRLEDLPLAKQDQRRTKSKRATGARRSHRKATR